MARMGRYELLRPVGRGGMADIFLARRRGPGGVEKQLVLKRIRPERVRDPRFLELFVREAELSMSLVHKNIVPVFDFGRADDELFLVMEQVDGFDLGALFGFARTHQRPLDSLLVAFIGLEACQGLDYAHRRSDASGPRAVFHRDVTPGNLLVSRDGEVKLVDFGVAARQTDLGEAGKVRGTPGYMAPEQARGETVDARADVYGLGLVLWEALCGTRARTAKNKEDMLALARTGAIEPLPDSVPLDLRQIIDRATAPERADRYGSARDMQLALDEYVIATRAANRGGAPPSHRLAEWLETIAPAQQDAKRLDTATVSAHGVVTFLDDGVDAVEQTNFGPDDNDTMHSIAETIGETIADADTGNQRPETRDQRPETGDRRPGTRDRRPALAAVVIAGTLLTVGTGIYLAARTNTPSQTASNTAVPGPTARQHGATVYDAGAQLTPPTSDAATAAARTDARTARATASHDAAMTTLRAAKRHTPRTPRTPRTQIRPPRSHADAAPQAAVAAGTVRISSSPWAEVSVAGHSAGCKDTPCKLVLPPGRYSVTLRNPVARVGKTLKVHVKSGEVTLVRETLTQRL